jgi:hypothetical protein
LHIRIATAVPLWNKGNPHERSSHRARDF